MAVELVAAPLMEAVMLRRPVVRVSGDASTEAPLMAALATMASRLRRMGLTVNERGEVLHSVEAPGRPEGEVAILLEAPFYEDLGTWVEEHARQTVILTGHDDEWRRVGVAPDIALAPFPEIGLEAWRARWREAALRGEDGALSAGLGCDLQGPKKGLHDVHMASTERPTGWHATDSGVWLPREELGRLVAERPEVWERVRALAALGPRHARSVALLEETCRTGS